MGWIAHGNAEGFDEKDGLQPPSALRVAKRALVLASVACRASLEHAPNDPEAQRMHTQLQYWIREVGIEDEFEENEWADVATKLGGLTMKRVIDCSWRSEGLVVLAWALQRCDLPPHDEQADGPDTADTIGFLTDDAHELLNNPLLRRHDQLEWIADLYLAIHWRIRQFSLDPQPIDFVEFAANCKWAVFPIEDVPMLESDLALRGRAVANAPEEVCIECRSIAQERQQAANWLIGTEPIYSNITCDT